MEKLTDKIDKYKKNGCLNLYNLKYINLFTENETKEGGEYLLAAAFNKT